MVKRKRSNVPGDPPKTEAEKNREKYEDSKKEFEKKQENLKEELEKTRQEKLVAEAERKKKIEQAAGQAKPPPEKPKKPPQPVRIKIDKVELDFLRSLDKSAAAAAVRYTTISMNFKRVKEQFEKDEKEAGDLADAASSQVRQNMNMLQRKYKFIGKIKDIDVEKEELVLE